MTDLVPCPLCGGRSGYRLVFAELFGRGDATLRECASALDQSRTAGRACERAYDALRVEP